MKRAFSWGVVLVLVVGGAVWAAARWSGPMRGGDTIGGKAYASEAAGGAASDFSSFCASCHGATGKGDGSAAASLDPRPKNFADCKTMAKISDETLFKAVKGGGQSAGLSTTMPAWGGALTDQQIHGLVTHIRGFCKK